MAPAPRARIASLESYTYDTITIAWWLRQDARVRSEYKRINAINMEKLEGDRHIPLQDLARDAVDHRNEAVLNMRRKTSPLGLLVALRHKSTLPEVETLRERKARSMYNCSWERCSAADRDMIYKSIMERSGSPNATFSALSELLPYVSMAIWALTKYDRDGAGRIEACRRSNRWRYLCGYDGAYWPAPERPPAPAAAAAAIVAVAHAAPSARDTWHPQALHRPAQDAGSAGRNSTADFFRVVHAPVPVKQRQNKHAKQIVPEKVLDVRHGAVERNKVACDAVDFVSSEFSVKEQVGKDVAQCALGRGELDVGHGE
ncbi:hypothetical protein BDV95DRAFT_590256 [Massariosphaeria phaeospora]|uniref:Uncharacterized protein n=1 Tax=Massariosphaeria phaeospora TaxID=100035 RepID=A0A7C8IJ02_9PLEO|nr:hypothetical protein BDV95DRAFT_590256 [Massariosphaeria phaeospora]